MCKINNLSVKGQGMPKTKVSFTQISNEILLDERLSFKARGILVLLLSRPKKWKIYIDEIVERSNSDGKYAVRAGFKELKELGYLKLVKVWNKETKKFEGTVYQLCQKPTSTNSNNSNEPTKKPIVEKSERSKSSQTKKQTLHKSEVPKSRPTKNLSVEQPHRPKTITPSNTNSSNTKHSNTIIQQQQKAKQKSDVADFKNNENRKTVFNKTEVAKNAATLLPYLQKDEIWKKQFTGKNICKQPGQNEILTNPKMEALLQHFAKTSISSGMTYVNIVEIKRHFFNWFNANLNKNALSNYIEQQIQLPKKVRKQIAILIPKTNAILDKIYGQQCQNKNMFTVVYNY